MGDIKSGNEAIEKMMTGMRSFLSTKTVVGEPIVMGDVTLIPLVEVSFGMGAHSGESCKKSGGTGGIGGKMIPSAVLVISKGSARVVNVKNQDVATRIIDMIPDIVDRFTQDKDQKTSVGDAEAVDIAFDRTEQ